MSNDGKTVIRQDGGIRKARHGMDKHPMPPKPKSVNTNKDKK